MTRPEDLSPLAALEQARAARSAVVDRVGKSSWSYDLIYSALASGLVASQALPVPTSVLGMGACTLALVVLSRTWASRTGVWITGVTPAKARWVAIGLGLVMATLMLAGVYLRRTTGEPWGPLALFPAAFLVALAGSRLWWAVYRRETRILP